MDYPEWLGIAKKYYEFRTLKDFSYEDKAIYIVHLGCPIQAIEKEIEAEVPATCFVNLDSETNDIGLCDKLVKSGWEIGYRARMDSDATLFKGELSYLSQFFDIKRYWCEQTFPIDISNVYFFYKDFIKDISLSHEDKIQILIKGNI